MLYEVEDNDVPGLSPTSLKMQVTYFETSITATGDSEQEALEAVSLEMLKESYFTAKKAPKAQTENLSVEVDIDAAGNSPDYMNSYLRTLGAVSKK